MTGSLLRSVESEMAEAAGQSDRTRRGCRDGRQGERVVVTNPVVFSHVFLVLESAAIEGDTAGGAGECGRHFCAVWVCVGWLVDRLGGYGGEIESIEEDSRGYLDFGNHLRDHRRCYNVTMDSSRVLTMIGG